MTHFPEALIFRLSPAAILLAGLLVAAPGLAQAPPFLLAWGSYGNGSGEFLEPQGVAVDAVGNVYVVDHGYSQIKVFSSSGGFLRHWGRLGHVGSRDPGNLSSPADVAIDAQGYVYVSDWGNSRVQKFRSDTTFVTAWGDHGSGDGQFIRPQGIAVDALGNVYVADAGNDRVQKFTSDGTFLLKWSVGDFSTEPLGIEVEASGNILVGTVGQPASIKRFSPTGAFLGQVGIPGCGLGFVCEPFALAVDASGNVYQAEGSINRAQVFSSTGTFLAGWGSQGSGPGEFRYALGIALGPGGEIYVSDGQNYRIQKFGPLSTPTVHSTWGRLKSLYR